MLQTSSPLDYNSFQNYWNLEIGMRGFPIFLILTLTLLAASVSSAEVRYELSGKILQEDGNPYPATKIEVVLHGAVTPFHAETFAGRDGQFKFKKLPAGTYTLIVYIPRVGENRKTVEVGPSFADSKRVVETRFLFGRETILTRNQSVSAVELSVPQKARKAFIQAQECIARQDLKRAIEHLKMAVEIAPQYIEAWNNLGTIAYQTKEFEEAEKYFREALKHDPESYFPLLNLGGTLLSMGRFEESLPFNTQTVEMKPGDALAQSQLGQSYYYLGQVDAAEKHLKQAKSLDPGNFSYPQLFLLQIYAKRNQLPEAILEMEEFLKLHPDSPRAPGIQDLLQKVRAMQ
jgi:Flp pilus assembly protein TadD